MDSEEGMVFMNLVKTMNCHLWRELGSSRYFEECVEVFFWGIFRSNFGLTCSKMRSSEAAWLLRFLLIHCIERDRHLVLVHEAHALCIFIQQQSNVSTMDATNIPTSFHCFNRILIVGLGVWN